jgi:hypothetical protein
MAKDSDEDRERRLRNQAAYRERNREELRETGAAYRENNRESIATRDQARREADPEGYLVKRRAYAKAYRNRINAWVLQERDKPCTDCGTELPPQIMEFDHVRGEKVFTISHWQKQPKRNGLGREDQLRLEIAKCEVRCPNCHRLRHFLEQNGHYEKGSDRARRKGKKQGKGFVNVNSKRNGTSQELRHAA